MKKTLTEDEKITEIGYRQKLIENLSDQRKLMERK